MKPNLLESVLPKPYRLFFQLLLLACLGSIAFYFYQYAKGEANTIPWTTQTHVKSLSTPVYSFDHGLFHFEVPSESYIIRETFDAGNLQLNPDWAWVFLGFSLFGFSLLLACISGMNRFWFLVSSLGVIIFLTQIELSQLQLFGIDHWGALACAISGILLLLYLFNAFFKNTGFVLRFALFLALTGGLSLLAVEFSPVAFPQFHLANYSLLAWTVLSMLFILWTASELFVFLIKILASSPRSGKPSNLVHFLLFSALLLFNLFGVYVNSQEAGASQWVWLDSFLLLVLASAAGLLNLRKRTESWRQVFSYSPMALGLYAGLAIICFSTIGYVFSSANTPLVRAFEDAILFSQIGMGLAIVLYTFIYFGALLKKNAPIYQVFYKPYKGSYRQVWLVGSGIIVLLLMQSNQRIISRSFAGYYNGIADVYYKSQEYHTAKNYYSEAGKHAFTNFRSRYAIASLEERENKPYSAQLALEKSIQESPNPYSIVKLAKIYSDNYQYFNALFTLKRGLKLFPEEGHIQNNLGMLMSKTSVNDSSAHLFRRAMQGKNTREQAEKNLYALFALKKLSHASDSLANWINATQNIDAKANLLASANQCNDNNLNIKFDQALENIGFHETLLFNNLNVNQKHSMSHLDSVFSRASENEKNKLFGELILYNQALALYKKGHVAKAFEKLEYLAQTVPAKRDEYHYVLALLSLEQQAPLKALAYIETMTNPEPFGEIDLLLAVSLLEARREIPETLLDSLSANSPAVARDLRWLQSKPSVADAMASSDIRKFLWLQAGNHANAGDTFILNTLDAKGIRDLAILKQIQKKERMGLEDAAFDFPTQKNDTLQRSLVKPFMQQQLLNSLKHKMWKVTQRLIGSKTISDGYKSLGRAVLAENQGDKSLADSLYTDLATNNPFFVWGNVYANRFWLANSKADFAYKVIHEAYLMNPDHAAIVRCYIESARRAGLDRSANIALEEFRKTTTEEAFERMADWARKTEAPEEYSE
ncbi:MAG: hypothetical protein MI784_07520 [Cytophagales bacterium]|nr:hypothetical protein [Cytophagales bacterium]